MRMAQVTINEAWCKGCKLCIHWCPVQALTTAEHLTRRAIHPPELTKPQACTGCRLCELVCPDFAVTVTTAAQQEVAR
jgi:2-oxoglutarate ferredoxin oxidoreductase subunit delta